MLKNFLILFVVIFIIKVNKIYLSELPNKETSHVSQNITSDISQNITSDVSQNIKLDKDQSKLAGLVFMSSINDRNVESVNEKKYNKLYYRIKKYPVKENSFDKLRKLLDNFNKSILNKFSNDLKKFSATNQIRFKKAKSLLNNYFKISSKPFESPIEYKLEGSSDVFSLAKLKNELLAAGYLDGTIIIWDLKTKLKKYKLEGHSAVIWSLVELDNDELASASGDKTIIIWDLKTKSKKYVLQGHSDVVSSLAKLDNDELASGSYDKSIIIWDLKTRSMKYKLEEHSDRVTSLEKLENGELASGSDDDTIIIWEPLRYFETKIGKCEEKIYKRIKKYVLKGHSGNVNSLLKLENGELASGSSDKSIIIWDLKSKSIKYKLDGHTNNVNSLVKLDNHKLASASGDKTVIIWDLKSKSIKHKLDGHLDWVRSLAKLENGELASASADKTIIIWDLKKSKSLTNKNGRCPRREEISFGFPAVCHDYCDSDSSCPLEKKCCKVSACMKTCLGKLFNYLNYLKNFVFYFI